MIIKKFTQSLKDNGYSKQSAKQILLKVFADYNRNKSKIENLVNIFHEINEVYIWTIYSNYDSIDKVTYNVITFQIFRNNEYITCHFEFNSNKSILRFKMDNYGTFDDNDDETAMYFALIFNKNINIKFSDADTIENISFKKIYDHVKNQNFKPNDNGWYNKGEVLEKLLQKSKLSDWQDKLDRKNNDGKIDKLIDEKLDKDSDQYKRDMDLLDKKDDKK